MNAFTPGPWRYRKGDNLSCPYVIRGTEGGFAVMGLSRSREEADARLIAAAPELLEALQEIVDFPMDFFDRDDAEKVQITVTGWHLKKAISAIAKARGES